MTIDPKPGHEPDPRDMSGALEGDGEAQHHSTTLPNVADDAEEEAARLGDFA